MGSDSDLIFSFFFFAAIFRTYSLSQPRHRIIPVLVICFALAEIVFGAVSEIHVPVFAFSINFFFRDTERGL